MSSEASVTGWSTDPRSSESSASESFDDAEPTSFGPFRHTSTLRSTDLEYIRLKYFVPQEFNLELADPEDRITDPAIDQVGVYEECFRAGLRLPFHPFIILLLKSFGIAPCCLAPNSWRSIIAFLSHLLHLGIHPTLRLFRACFMLKDHPREIGWWYLSPRQGCRLIKGAPSSVHNWKERFFFVSSDQPWGFDTSWNRPRSRENKKPNLTETEAKFLDMIYSAPVAPLRVLLSEQSLYEVGLSPMNPLGEVLYLDLFILLDSD